MDWLLSIFDPATIGGLITDFKAEIQQPAFYVGLAKIIWIDILLSGDNALVIALACRNLEPRQRFWGMILGAGAAVLLRIVFAGIVVTLMGLPYLKLVGGLALIVIAAKLLVPEKENKDDVASAANLWAAIQIVAIADVVMSLDNVIAVAVAAGGSMSLLIIGLLISIPMIVAGAALIMALLDKFPALVWFGAALLGWVAGEVMATDPAIQPALRALLGGDIALTIDTTSSVFGFAKQLRFSQGLIDLIFGLLSVAIVLTWGGLWRRKRLREMHMPADTAMA